MDLNGLWGIVIIVGPILLAGAIIWAMRNNRVSRSEAARSEQATAELYDKQDREDKFREGS